MMRLPEDKWQEADCPPNRGEGLVWRQDLCNCGEELVPQDPNDICGLQGYNPYPNNRHKYMRVIHVPYILMLLKFSIFCYNLYKTEHAVNRAVLFNFEYVFSWGCCYFIIFFYFFKQQFSYRKKNFFIDYNSF